MTVIRPNSISGINSITANGGDINLFRADGTKADVPIVNNITAGVVTATKFVGPIEGNLSNGTINATSGTITGNLGVGGVLTYEDVTNIDSVGVVTAREGIKIPDNKYIKIGSSDDLQIYHDAGAGSHINNTGLLNIDGTTGVRLEYNNATKLQINSSGAIVTGILTATNIDYTTAPFNAVINGDMKISQRTNEVNYGNSVTGITADTFVVDRWEWDLNLGTWTVSHVNESPSASGIQYSMKAECTATGTVGATSLIRFRQKIEGQQALCFGDKDYSLSFWFKSNVNGVYTAMLRNNQSSKNSPVSFTVSDNNWHHYKFNLGSAPGTINYYNQQSFELCINVVAGTDYSSGTPNSGWTTGNGSTAAGHTANCNSVGAIVYLTGVQLQPGPVCTPFINETYGETLMKCYRYYVRLYTNTSDYPLGYGYKYSNTSHAVTVPLPTRMRTTPVGTYSNLRVRGMNMNGVNNMETVTSLGSMAFSYGSFQSFTANTDTNHGGIGQAVMLTNSVSNNTSWIAFDSEM